MNPAAGILVFSPRVVQRVLNRWWAMVLVAIVATACSTRSTTPAPVPEAAPVPVVAKSVQLIDGGSPAPDARGDRCVFHAGQIDKRTTQETLPGGVPGPTKTTASCSMNASCIEQQGRDTPGDATASIDCKEKNCTCTIEGLSPRAKPRRWRIVIDALCDSAERAQSLLRSRCMADLDLAPR